MHTRIIELPAFVEPEALMRRLEGKRNRVLLRSGDFSHPHARYSIVCAEPMITLRAFGSRCEIAGAARHEVSYGNPWHLMGSLMSRFEVPDDPDYPFPLGGCFGYWGYDLKHFVEPRLPRRLGNDTELPDCVLGFYSSLVVLDHRKRKMWIVATGLQPDGTRSSLCADQQQNFWLDAVGSASESRLDLPATPGPAQVASSMTKESFIAAVSAAKEYIRTGHIYQVNLSHRLTVQTDLCGWNAFERLLTVAPAPYAAFMDCGDIQLASSSPELFLQMSGRQITTRPIKGTRPRSRDPEEDMRLMHELRTSEKEMAELVMITDLLRNDLGKVCEFGSVTVPDLAVLEQFSHVQHLVSTVQGRLRDEVTHLDALHAGFPGGSITGAPKIRAMEIIDELEPVSRGPYTGCLGYLGFNQESQLSIVIRTAVCRGNQMDFNVGAGIVADSDPGLEYEETLIKARGFMEILRLSTPSGAHSSIVE